MLADLFGKQHKPVIDRMHDAQAVFDRAIRQLLPDAVGAKEEGVAIAYWHGFANVRFGIGLGTKRTVQQGWADVGMNRMTGVRKLLHESVIARALGQQTAAEPIQAAVTQMRPLGDALLSIDEQCRHGGGHAVLCRIPPLFGQDCAIRRIDGGAQCHFWLAGILAGASQQGRDGQLRGNLAAGATCHTITDNEATVGLPADMSDCILVFLPASRMGELRVRYLHVIAVQPRVRPR